MSTLFRLSATIAFATLPVFASAADLGLPHIYECGGHTIAIAADANDARVRIGGVWRTLAPTVSASGAKYAAPDDPETWVWGKGEEFSVKLPETGEIACTATAAATVFSAGGNEPGWHLAIDGDRARLTTIDGSETDLTVTGNEPVAGGRRIAMGDAGAVVTDALCHDDATGMPHPQTVTLSANGTEMSGCGGAALDLLTGIDWRISAAGGAVVPDGVEAGIRFHPDGSFSGSGGCNAMRGAFSLTGEGLSIGPAAMTRKLCEEPAMQVELAVGAALATIVRFDFAGDGRLLLLAGDAPVIEAHP